MRPRGAGRRPVRAPGRPRRSVLSWLLGLLVVAVATAGVSLITLARVAPPRTSVPATSPKGLSHPGVKARPCTGMRVTPQADVQAAIDASPPGATLCLQAGTFRLSRPLRPKDGQRLYGQQGTILSGAKRIDGWTRDPGNGWWWHGGDTTRPARLVGRCADGADACKYPDDVWRDGVRLRRVTSLRALVPGTVFVDYGADRIFVRDDPTHTVVELSVTPWAIVSGGENQGTPGVMLTGLVVEKFATPAQTDTIWMGPRWTVDGIEVRDNHGIGVGVGSHSVLRRSHIHHQGQLGVSGSGAVGALVEGNEIDHNNTAGYDGNWEAGGCKWVLETRDLTVRGNYVHDNDGQGLWTDTDNLDITYERNVVHDNTGSGIFHETSDAAVIRGNDVRHNAEVASGRSIWHGADILLNDSQNVEIYGNTIVSKSNGIGLIDVDRGSGPFGTYRLWNVLVHDNVMTLTSGARTGLVGRAATSKNDDIRFRDNTYYVPDGAGHFWQWCERPLTVDQWRHEGHDRTGVFLVR